MKKRIFLLMLSCVLMSACNDKSEDLTVPKGPVGTDKTPKKTDKINTDWTPVPAQLDLQPVATPKISDELRKKALEIIKQLQTESNILSVNSLGKDLNSTIRFEPKAVLQSTLAGSTSQSQPAEETSVTESEWQKNILTNCGKILTILKDTTPNKDINNDNIHHSLETVLDSTGFCPFKMATEKLVVKINHKTTSKAANSSDSTVSQQTLIRSLSAKYEVYNPQLRADLVNSIFISTDQSKDSIAVKKINDTDYTDVLTTRNSVYAYQSQTFGAVKRTDTSSELLLFTKNTDHPVVIDLELYKSVNSQFEFKEFTLVLAHTEHIKKPSTCNDSKCVYTSEVYNYLNGEKY